MKVRKGRHPGVEFQRKVGIRPKTGLLDMFRRWMEAARGRREAKPHSGELFLLGRGPLRVFCRRTQGKSSISEVTLVWSVRTGQED